MIVDLVEFMAHTASEATDHVVFEGAQGALLDLDQGTYPYVSSGYAAAAGASLGGGIGPRSVGSTGCIGVFKAYSTRVGNGPFPTEFRERRRVGTRRARPGSTGREYGVTTGRPRRCGYLDLVALKYIARANGIDGLALTHLDVYDSLDEMKVCVAYESERWRARHLSGIRVPELDRCTTRDEERLPGWGESTIGGGPLVRRSPAGARKGVHRLHRRASWAVPIDIVGRRLRARTDHSVSRPVDAIVVLDFGGQTAQLIGQAHPRPGCLQRDRARDHDAAFRDRLATTGSTVTRYRAVRLAGERTRRGCAGARPGAARAATCPSWASVTDCSRWCTTAGVPGGPRDGARVRPCPRFVTGATIRSSPPSPKGSRAG